MVPVYIALGSNVGQKLQHLQEAVDRLKGHLTIKKASSVYETAPMYVEDQPAFYNAAIQADTDLSPIDLLKLLKQTEKAVGRQDRARYGPREVDLDLIAYGVIDYKYTSGGHVVLQLPHPKTGERRFVLQPLCDLDDKVHLASLGSIGTLLAKTCDQEKDIRRIDAVLSI